MMKTIWICVYRDTVEEHNEIDNLAEVQVTKDFFEKYFNEFKKEYFDSVEDFLNEYTADDTIDFYGYAVEHNAVIQVDALPIY